jgi:sulfite exporter TauE/SafE
MSEQKTYTLNVHGMHCTACTLLIESELAEHPNVASARPSLTTRTVEICGDFGDISPDDIAAELSKLLSEHRLSIEPERAQAAWGEFSYALPIALVFIAGFILLQKLGIVNLINTSNVSYGTAFMIGVIASLSTCMAVVGGLVLSMSATFAREGDKMRPQILFHIGRIASFFILGGVIGALGSAFTLGVTGTFIVGLLVGVVMLILGINLLDVFPWAKRFQPAMPKFLAKHALGVSEINHTLTPLLVGVATFFLPCGFTQAMQFYSLSTGSFLMGGLTMLAFALGTLPVLALIGFSSFSIKNSAKAGIFFKSAGLIVILFALFNLINSLVAFGLIAPVFNF